MGQCGTWRTTAVTPVDPQLVNVLPTQRAGAGNRQANGAACQSDAEGDDGVPKVWCLQRAPATGLRIRKEPDIEGEMTGGLLHEGDLFRVREKKLGADGVTYLLLADGRGWAFNRRPGTYLRAEEHEARLDSPNPEERAAAAFLLGEHPPEGPAKNAPALAKLLMDEASGVRRAAARALRGGGRQAAAQVAQVLVSEKPESRALAAEVLGKMWEVTQPYVEDLAKISASDKELGVRVASERAMRLIKEVPQQIVVSRPGCWASGLYTQIEGSRSGPGGARRASMPLWERADGGGAWLYAGQDGRWWIGDKQVKESNFQCSAGCIRSRIKHNGALPPEVPSGWEIHDGRSFHTDVELTVQELPCRDVASPAGHEFATRGWPGYGSFRFASGDASCTEAFLCHDSLRCATMTLDDGCLVPHRKAFVNSLFNEATQTFSGEIDWSPTSLNGHSRVAYELVFSDGYSRISGGQAQFFRKGESQACSTHVYGSTLGAVRYDRWHAHAALMIPELSLPRADDDPESAARAREISALPVQRVLPRQRFDIARRLLRGVSWGWMRENMGTCDDIGPAGDDFSGAGAAFDLRGEQLRAARLYTTRSLMISEVDGFVSHAWASESKPKARQLFCELTKAFGTSGRCSATLWLDKFSLPQAGPLAAQLPKFEFLLQEYLVLSPKLLVLFSPQYLNRLWCRYEFVTFLTLHQTTQVFFGLHEFLTAGTRWEEYEDCIRNSSMDGAMCANQEDAEVLRHLTSESFTSHKAVDAAIRLASVALVGRSLLINYTITGNMHAESYFQRLLRLSDQLGFNEVSQGFKKIVTALAAEPNTGGGVKQVKRVHEEFEVLIGPCLRRHLRAIVRPDSPFKAFRSCAAGRGPGAGTGAPAEKAIAGADRPL